VNFYLKKIDGQDWRAMSKPAHQITFGEIRDPDIDRIDFSLITVDDKGEIAGYVTCIEMDRETVYWQHGGAMPEYKGSIYNLKGYTLGINWCREQYKRISTKIENTNTVMLKFALKQGFTIVGTHTFKNKIYVDLLNEFGG